MKSRGIAFKLISLICVTVTLILVFVVQHNQTLFRKLYFNSVGDNAENLAFSNLYKIESILKAVEKVPQHIAYSLEHSTFGKDDVLKLTRQIVDNNPEIYGSTIAFEPFKFESVSEYFAPYYFKSNGKTNFTYIGGKDYKYFSWDWYRIPKEKNSPNWTEPFFDEGGGDIIMSTYSAPFYKTTKGIREFMGVVTADISLSWLTEIVSSMKITPTGYAFLISKNGTFITHPQERFIMNETIFTLAEKLDDPSLKNIGNEMVGGNMGALTNTTLFPGQKAWIFFHPLTTNGWSMAVVFPENDVFAGINRISIRIIFVSTIGLVFLLLGVIWISRSITKPIRILSKVTDEIAEGNLDVPIPEIKSSDEIGKLAGSYILMRDNLKKHIKEVTHLTADKERLESELNFAARVQQGFLPQELPKYLNYEFGAVTVPSKFVGGDFYDLIPLQNGRLGLVIGDVSGKGVPAALHMAQLLSDFRHISQTVSEPDQVMQKINNILHKRSSHGMFATATYITLDIENKKMWIANAGHFPLVIRNHEGVISQHGLNGGIPLGILPNSKYQKEQVSLKPGDIGLLYSDGATEAQNKNKQQFNFDGISNILEQEIQDSPEELISHLQEGILRFTENVPPHDDMTFLSFRVLKK